MRLSTTQNYLLEDLLASPRVIYVLLSLAAFILLSQILTWLLSRVIKRKNFKNIHERLISWWLILSVISFSMVLGRLGTLILFCIISIVAFKEFIKVVDLDLPKSIIVLGFVSIPIQYLIVWDQTFETFLIFIPLIMHTVLALILIVGQRVKGFVSNLGQLQWGLLLTVFSLSHLAYFMNLDDPTTMEVEPLGLVTYVIVVTQVNDVAQFIFGKAFGRHKIFPKVSPNKTVEGFLGGMLFTCLFSLFLGTYITSMSEMMCLSSGLILSVSGFFGDNLMSAIKRDREVKDYGSWLSGHGGILDRVDSLILAGPMFFHFYCYYFLGKY